MNDPARFVGRFASLLSSSVKDLRTRNVQVISFDLRNGMYKVKIIESGEHACVEFSQLKFYTSDDFLTRYPHAPSHIGNPEMSTVPAEAITHFPSMNRTIADSSLFIDNSCRITGDHTHKSIFSRNVYVNTIRGGDIVEFENLNFEQVDGKQQQIDCVRGCILFRNCTFGCTQRAVRVATIEDASARVVFESCVFQGHKECALLVESGRVIAVDCQLTDCGMAFVAKKHAFLSALYSSFERCVGGVVVPCGGEVHLFKCNFEKIVDFAVLASNGSEIDVKNCIIDRCNGDGIVVEGGYRTTAVIMGCGIQNCGGSGVRVGNGNITVSLHGTQVRKCAFGVYIAADCTGGVDVMKCKLISSRSSFDTSFVNLSGDKCRVSYEGGLCAPNTQLARLQQSETLMSETGIKYGYPVSAMCKRVLQQAGLTDIVCAKCKAVAPVGTMYKKCAHCREARYCSKQCQIAHILQHNVECTLLRLRSTLLSTCGYVSCDNCGGVEVLQTNEPHCACSRCLKVFYCSKQCQKAKWSNHKAECTPYK